MTSYNDDSSVSGHEEPWIQWFCGLKGHEMFCEIERSYIEDGFNLYGLRAYVPNFSDCLDLILDRIGPDDSDDSHITQNACTLYILIHARYIITAHGLDAMYNKYAVKDFGTCPLIQCNSQPVLPVGLSDELGIDTVKIFCPKCQCVYHPSIRSKNHPAGAGNGSSVVDGAGFGTTFPHLFLMTFSNLVPDGISPNEVYVPRVFGFRVHHSARQNTPGVAVGSPSFTVSNQVSGVRGNDASLLNHSLGTSGSGTNGMVPERTIPDNFGYKPSPRRRELDNDGEDDNSSVGEVALDEDTRQIRSVDMEGTAGNRESNARNKGKEKRRSKADEESLAGSGEDNETGSNIKTKRVKL